MDKTISDILSQLGLDFKETSFFLSSFKLGPATVNEIARNAKLERSTAYLIAQKLISQGFIEEDHKQYGKKLFAAEPKKLLQLLVDKQTQLKRQEAEFEEALPQLQAVYQASEVRPKVRVYEGNSGLLSVWKDILSSKTEILLWTNQETETSFFDEETHNKFIADRVRKKIPIRVLAVKNDRGMDLLKNSQEQLREVIHLPEGVSFSAETYIYDNKIAVLDYKKDVIGVIIESESIANSHRAIFEMNFNSLG